MLWRVDGVEIVNCIWACRGYAGRDCRAGGEQRGINLEGTRRGPDCVESGYLLVHWYGVFPWSVCWHNLTFAVKISISMLLVVPQVSCGGLNGVCRVFSWSGSDIILPSVNEYKVKLAEMLVLCVTTISKACLELLVLHSQASNKRLLETRLLCIWL